MEKGCKKKRGQVLAVVLSICIMAANIMLLPESAHAASYDDNGFATDEEGNKIYEPAILDDDNYYAIGNAGQLYWFAEKVNSGDNRINGKLTANITVNDGDISADESGNPIYNNVAVDDNTVLRDWTTISKYDESRNATVTFRGIFDGNNFTISGLYHNNTVAFDNSTNQKDSCDYGGIFSYNLGTIKNLNVKNSYFRTPYYAGGISGVNSGTIENCTNDAYVSALIAGGIAGSVGNNSVINKCKNNTNAYIKGDLVDAGIMAVAFGAIETITVSNCINSGKVEKTSYKYGGIIADGTLTKGEKREYIVKNCYNTVNFDDKDHEICGDIGNASISNCYYVSDKEDETSIDGVTGKTGDQFQSGEVAYLLNGETSESSEDSPLIWYQTLDTDIAPVLDNTHEVVYYENSGYTNKKITSVDVATPVAGAIPVTEIENTRYTGSVEWTPLEDKFGCDSVYKAVVTVTPKTGYELSDTLVDGWTLVSGTTNQIEKTFAKTADHKWGPWTVKTPATIEGEGLEERICSVCGKKETRAIAKLPIVFTSVDVATPAVGATPETTITGTEYTGTVEWSPAATEFACETEYKATVTVTSKTGYELSDTLTDGWTLVSGTTNQIEKTFAKTADHKWGPWTVKTPATIEGEGLEERICSVCGEKETRAIAKLPATSTQIVEKNKTYTVGSTKYKVTDASTNGTGTVTLTSTTKSKSKMTSYSVPSTTKINGKTFKVTAIGDKMFKNSKKLKKITIGSNIKTIGKDAFYGCKNLKTITIKSKQLTKVNKNAIKNIYKKAKIKVPSSKLSKYKKLFKKSTGFKKSMKIKK